MQATTSLCAHLSAKIDSDFTRNAKSNIYPTKVGKENGQNRAENDKFR